MAVNTAPTPTRPLNPTGAPKRPRNYQPLAWLYLAPVLISTFVLTVLPFLYTFYIAFTNYSLFHYNEFEWVGFENFREIFSAGSGFLPVMGWTVTWMILATALNIISGMLLAMMLSHPRLRERTVYRTLLIIPWALPFILTVQVWAGILNNQGPLNQILGMVGIPTVKWLQGITSARASLLMMNLWLSYPFFMTICLAALTAIPRELYEAADIDGASGWARFRYITYPFMLSALTPLLIMQLSFQFGNAGVIVLLTNGLPLAYPGSQYGATDTLATFAYKLVYSLRDYGLAAAYSIIIFIVISCLTITNSLVTGAFSEAD